MELDISPEVALEIRRLSEISGMSIDALLRKALKMPARVAIDGKAPASVDQKKDVDSEKKPFICDGYPLRVGLKLQMRDKKGTAQEARVAPDGIVILADKFKGRKFQSLSAAGRALKDYPVNGWVTWRFYDDERGDWRSVGDIRRS